MIITRSPLRISLGGGGTDLPSYYQEHEGFVLSAAIDKYVYITLHQSFFDNLTIKYSQMEKVQRLEDIQHPLVREALLLADQEARFLEIASMSDIPAGTGLGSSGSFLTALLHALHIHTKEVKTRHELAEQACYIEIDRLKEPVGKQDQYIAAFGGVTCFDFPKNGNVRANPLKISPETLANLEDNLVLFYTGITRSASQILREQDTRSKSKDQAMVDNLHFVKDLGLREQSGVRRRKPSRICRNHACALGAQEEAFRQHEQSGHRSVVWPRNAVRSARRKIDRCRWRRLPHVLHRRQNQAPPCYVPGWFARSAHALRFSRHDTGHVVLAMLPCAILAGGLATRLRPVTQTIPKALISICGRPFLDHQLTLLKSRGVIEVVLCIGYLGEMVQDVVGDGSRWGLRVQYSFDGPKLLGTGGAIRRALPLLGPQFFVLYGDSYLECDYAAVAEAFTHSRNDGLMTIFRNEGSYDTSNVSAESGKILRYDKRERRPDMHYIDYGLGAFQENVFQNGEPETIEDLAAVYQRLLSANQLAAFEVRQRFYEIGSRQGIEDLERHLKEKP